METVCNSICEDLKLILKQRSLSQDQEARFKSLKGMALRLSTSEIKLEWIENLSNQIKALKESKSWNIEPDLLNLEKIFLLGLLSPLEIPPKNFDDFYSQVLKESNQYPKICEIFPKILSKYLKNKINTEKISQLDFKHIIQHIFQIYHVPYNFYVENLEFWCFNKKYNYKLSRLEEFLLLFFGSSKNYKFFVRIAREIDPYKNMCFYENPYKITLTRMSKSYIGSNNTLELQKSFEVRHDISVKKYKCPQLVTFGKHPEADIVFPPDDNTIDQVVLILMNLNDNIYAIDVGKKTSTSCMLTGQKEYDVREDMIINLAKTQFLHIESIKYIDENESSLEVKQFNPNPEKVDISDNESSSEIKQQDPNPDQIDYYSTIENFEKNFESRITLKSIKGFYNQQSFPFQTQLKNNKSVFRICRGGENGGPDLFYPEESGVSGHHLVLAFNKKWTIQSFGKNGSYILLKSFSEYENKKVSKLIPILENQDSSSPSSPNFRYRIILIGLYLFYIEENH